MELELNLQLITITTLASFVATFFASLAGGGGGLILLPILLLTGLPYVNALSIHKIAMTAMGIGSGFRFKKENLLDKRTFIWTTLVGFPFVMTGIHLATLIPGETMKPIVGIMALIISFISILKKPELDNRRYLKLNPKRAIVGGLLLAPMGVYSGAIGGGVGLFTTFLYIYYFKYTQIRANAMTMVANGVSWNGIGAIALMILGYTLWPLVPGLVIGSLGGSYLGANAGIKAGNKVVRIFFLSMAVLIGVALIKG